MKLDPFSPRIGSWVWNVQQDRLYGDPLICDYFGLDAAEGAIGQPMERYFRAIHSDDRDRVRHAFCGACTSGEAYSETYRVRTRHGDERLVMAEGRCYYDERGSPTIYPGHVVDIGDIIGRDPTLDDLQDHLHMAMLKARQLRLKLAHHLISMAILEVSDARDTVGELTNRLN